MKEATGELSTTVIAVVAIAAISAVFMTFLYPQLKASIILNQACSNGPGYLYKADDNKYSVACSSTTGTGGNKTSEFSCGYWNNANATTTDVSSAYKSKQCNVD